MSKSFNVQANVIAATIGVGSRKAGNTGGALSRFLVHDVFAGGVKAADAIVTSVAAAVGAVDLIIAAQPDFPRNITITADAGQTETITLTGTDQFDNAQSEVITFNGAATVVGTKVFKTLTTVRQAARSGAANISVGTGDIIGTSRRVIGCGMSSGVYTTASGETTMVQDTTCPVKAPTANVHGVSFQHALAAATTTELVYWTDEAR